VVVKIVFLQSFENQNERIHQSSNPPKSGYIMAEVNSAPQNSGRRKMNIRIDFTPMVDLGFLLITFFMLATRLAQPNLVALVMPEDDGGERDPLKASRVLTIRLGEGDKIYYYEGLFQERFDTCDFSAQGLRQLLLNKKIKVAQALGEESYRRKLPDGSEEERIGSKLFVVIEPTPQASYKNLVDALDEMSITQVRYYCIQ